MTTTNSQLVEIKCVAGVQPETDRTSVSTPHFVMSDKVRFIDGVPQKIGGWKLLDFDGQHGMAGKCRSMFSSFANENWHLIAGTHSKLYSIKGQRLANITPLNTAASVNIDSFETDYRTLGNNPISVELNSNVVTVSDPNADKYLAGDIISISGASSVGGISVSLLNTNHIISNVTGDSYSFIVGTVANETATGGGSSVIVSSGVIKTGSASHGLSNGDRIKIFNLPTSVGGIDKNYINAEHVIRNADTDSFYIVVSEIAAGTSTAGITFVGAGAITFIGTGSISFQGMQQGGGAKYYKEISAGNEHESYGLGYGVGLYGIGKYGIALESEYGRRYPRIWHIDRFAETFIIGPGNNGPIYIWSGSAQTAPSVLANSPAEANYVFVSNGFVVALGVDTIANKIKTSDQYDPEQWTASSANQVYEDSIEGAGRFISHAPMGASNLLFTETQTYLFSYIGPPLIWKIDLLDANIGIIAPLARVVVGGVPYWMGQNNFYMYDGGAIKVIPSNSGNHSTILNYVFDNVYRGQKSKIFAWYNERYSEIWWHYPSGNSLEPDRVARLNIKDFVWVPDTMDRTAAEYPAAILGHHRLADSSSNIWWHERGADAGDDPLEFSIRTKKFLVGKEAGLCVGIIPDSAQDNNISVNVRSWQRPQSTSGMYSNTFSISPDTELYPLEVGGRIYDVEISGNALGQTWQMGAWYALLQGSSTL